MTRTGPGVTTSTAIFVTGEESEEEEPRHPTRKEYLKVVDRRPCNERGPKERWSHPLKD